MDFDKPVPVTFQQQCVHTLSSQNWVGGWGEINKHILRCTYIALVILVDYLFFAAAICFESARRFTFRVEKKSNKRQPTIILGIGKKTRLTFSESERFGEPRTTLWETYFKPHDCYTNGERNKQGTSCK